MMVHFIPIIVFDSQQNPLKSDENKRHKNPEEQEKACHQLQEIYMGQRQAPYKDVLKLWKVILTVTSNMLEPTIEALKKKGIHVIGSLYEADHQLVSLAL